MHIRKPLLTFIHNAFSVVFCLCALAFTLRGTTESMAIYPDRDVSFTQSLNGAWKFKYIASLDAGRDSNFFAPDFDVASWKSIRVPGNWELQGFAEPFYDLALKDGEGLYRRTFQVPSEWCGRIVCLRFDGVAYGFEVWVNGQKIGESKASAYTPNTFDITNALQTDSTSANTLAVKVTTKPRGWEFDINDDWSLSGIYRDVTLFSVPQTHVQDITTRTKLLGDGTAELFVAAQIKESESIALHGKLIAPDGKLAAEFDLAHQSDGLNATTVRVSQPQLWTAETPTLYRLQLSLAHNGQQLQTIEERLGLREVSIIEGVLQLNGRPIKLRGANRHDLSPDVGRAVTETHMRRDLQLMKDANINFVRTSHYPPHPRFIELCDELGFYVMCEIPISSKGKAHLEKPDYRDIILARVEPTITRDKNRPSVIIWSIGNENPISEVEMDAGRLAKQLDPTRPICIPKIGSYFAKNYERIPAFVDIYAPHYPSNSTVREYAEKLTRPIIHTEYAHAFGLATDRVQDQWETMQASPRYAGAAIWHFMDQGLLRYAPVAIDRDARTDYAWLDQHHYYDTNGFDGVDGIVYSDRTPQVDYWQVRKVYAPVQIAERTANVKSGNNTITLTVENRYDFRALSGMKIVWALRRNNHETDSGSVTLRAASHEKEQAHVSINIPDDAAVADDIFALDVRIFDESGLQINERTLRLTFSTAPTNKWLSQLPTAPALEIREADDDVSVIHPQWTLRISQKTGELSIRDNHGRTIVSDICPHTGRKPTMTDRNGTDKESVWLTTTLAKNDTPKVFVAREGETVRLTVSGHYPRAESPTQAFIGDILLRFHATASFL